MPCTSRTTSGAEAPTTRETLTWTASPSGACTASVRSGAPSNTWATSPSAIEPLGPEATGSRRRAAGSVASVSAMTVTSCRRSS